MAIHTHPIPLSLVLILYSLVFYKSIARSRFGDQSIAAGNSHDAPRISAALSPKTVRWGQSGRIKPPRVVDSFLNRI